MIQDLAYKYLFHIPFNLNDVYWNTTRIRIWRNLVFSLLIFFISISHSTLFFSTDFLSLYILFILWNKRLSMIHSICYFFFSILNVESQVSHWILLLVFHWSDSHELEYFHLILLFIFSLIHTRVDSFQ